MRIGTGSCYNTGRGSRATSQHNSDPFCPVPISVGGLTSRESLRDNIFRSAEDIKGTVLFRGLHHIRGSFCIWKLSMWTRKAAYIRYREKYSCWKCCCLPCSKSGGRLYNVGIVGGWIGCIGGGLVVTLMLPTLYSTTRWLLCCLFGTTWSACICQISWPYMPGGSLCPLCLGQCWWPGLLVYPKRPLGLWRL